ncbi:RluA family pseudouridine synthase [Capillimicrobium parvum]|uniref:Pseudouridine synthase n=1 Tax=Capillimicrobium parvum TaxID=2884022 RepID=A0A9E6XXL6_9ACTN|nr:RluA family pseudouridine synthase [Capillimicrobium parvum]UGS36319.1 putative RNA pseudouridine synthase [Capillimicrobium parvum]
MIVEIADEQAGLRLDHALAGPLGSRSRAQRLIDAGLVTVDGRRRPKRHVLEGGERVEVADRAEPEPVEDGELVDLRIAYEDGDLLVVDKPAGLVVHPAAGHATGTLSQALAARGIAAERGGIVHRLDRDTSGLLLAAKDEDTLRALQDELRERRIEREYLALVEGRPPARTGTIDAPIGRDRRDRLRHSTDTATPRDAVTHFEIERSLPATTLLRVRLETGRTHQIRVHLSEIGHPVVGDREYGGGGALAAGLERQFLHAARLAFDHPRTGERIEVVSPLPPELTDALRRAEKALH